MYGTGMGCQHRLVNQNGDIKYCILCMGHISSIRLDNGTVQLTEQGEQLLEDYRTEENYRQSDHSEPSRTLCRRVISPHCDRVRRDT